GVVLPGLRALPLLRVPVPQGWLAGQLGQIRAILFPGPYPLGQELDPALALEPVDHPLGRVDGPVVAVGTEPAVGLEQGEGLSRVEQGRGLEVDPAEAVLGLEPGQPLGPLEEVEGGEGLPVPQLVAGTVCLGQPLAADPLPGLEQLLEAFAVLGNPLGKEVVLLVVGVL